MKMSSGAIRYGVPVSLAATKTLHPRYRDLANVKTNRLRLLGVIFPAIIPILRKAAGR